MKKQTKAHKYSDREILEIRHRFLDIFCHWFLLLAVDLGRLLPLVALASPSLIDRLLSLVAFFHRSLSFLGRLLSLTVLFALVALVAFIS